MHPLALVSVTVVLRGNSQAISVSHLTGDEILSPEQFPVKKKTTPKKQALCDEDVRTADCLHT